MNQTPREVLDTTLGHLGFVVEIEEEERDGHLILQIKTTEPKRLIGRRDETLESLQFLVNRILQTRNHGAHRIHQLADAVRSNGRPVETEPLNSYDRRLVHNAYREDAELETASHEGVDKIKRMTIRRRG